jgi:Tol biopolymer transport system component/subtilisin family serine protease
MPTIVAHHDVDDTALWLTSPRRAAFFASSLGLSGIRTVTNPRNPTQGTRRRKRARGVVVGLVVVAALWPADVLADAGPDETPDGWIVELSSNPTADGTAVATIKSEQAAFRSIASKAGIDYKERRSFQTLFNGISLTVPRSELAALTRLPGVTAVYPNTEIDVPDEAVAEPELDSAPAVTGADVARSKLGYTGTGIKVGVIDTGVDYDHPDLGGCYGPDCRVATGYDFVGDAYIADDPEPVISPDSDPDDCAGHGTHVAGIVGANGSVVGVAPAVTFGAYRVFGCNGGTSADVAIAAMERALADGMQVVNMSFGGPFEWPSHPMARAADRLVNKGVVVVAAIGNNGGSGLWATGAPAIGRKTIGTASFGTAFGVSFSSSWGLSPDLALKPDIGAPGEGIFSTYPIERGSYATLSGTSMASPQVAGAVALLLQAKPHTPAAAVRDILQNSADPKRSSGVLEPVQHQGAGVVDTDEAILATTRVSPGKLELGESEAGPATRTLQISNGAAQAVSYDLSSAPARATGPNTFPIGIFDAAAAVAFSRSGVPVSAITVPAGATVSLDVTIGPATSLLERSIYGGYVVLTPQAPGQTLHVPYAGLRGDYQSVQVLTPTPNGYPLLGRRVPSNDIFLRQSAGAVFSLLGNDKPFVVVHLDHQASFLRLRLRDAVSGRSWHTVIAVADTVRSSAANGFIAFAIDGSTAEGKRTYIVPDGRYVAELSVLKPLGDGANPAHTETWTSPEFVVRRPDTTGLHGKIAFASYRDGNFDVHVMDAGGANPTNLTNYGAADDLEPAWSPDGRKIAFERRSSANDLLGDIWVMDADGANATNLTDNPVEDRHPTWSPDGRRIAFERAGDIWVMNADGSALTNLTNSAAREREPAWSRDGEKIAYRRSADVFVMDANGSNQTNLTNSPALSEATPAWSPDSQKIAFRGDAELFVMDADGSNPTNLTPDAEGVDWEPEWSPDGQKIVFASDRGEEEPELYVMDRDGAHVTRLTGNAAFDNQPSWTP